MKKIGSLFILIAIFNLSFVSMSEAYILVCESEDCVTTINTYEGGFNWSILCDDGSHSSGSSTGEYVGSCS